MSVVNFASFTSTFADSTGLLSLTTLTSPRGPLRVLRLGQEAATPKTRRFVTSIEQADLYQIADIQAQIDSTVDIMHQNITKVAERGERLDNLQDKTGASSAQLPC